MFKLAQTLPVGCVTLLGSTSGPAVNTQIARPQWFKTPVFLSRLEVSEAVRLMPEVADERAAERGWLSPEQASELRDEVERLQQELAAESAVAEIIDYFEERAKRRPARAKVAGKPKVSA